MNRQRGFSMLEVLITLVILAFGLLSLINLQVKLQMNELESYQRGQAVVLVEDMANRMRVVSLTNVDSDANSIADSVERLANYDTGDGWLGVSRSADCQGGAQADCDAWDQLLQGIAVEQGGANLGAMVGARGCIEQIEPGDPGDGVCQPARYRVSVAWQGLFESAIPEQACASGQFGDNEGFRRVISTIVNVGTPGCI
jgi:type IV pilus assembly protein PilV